MHGKFLHKYILYNVEDSNMKLLKQKKIIRPHNKEIKEKDWVTLKRLIHGYPKIQMLKLSKNQKNLRKKTWLCDTQQRNIEKDELPSK